MVKYIVTLNQTEREIIWDSGKVTSDAETIRFLDWFRDNWFPDGIDYLNDQRSNRDEVFSIGLAFDQFLWQVFNHWSNRSDYATSIIKRTGTPPPLPDGYGVVPDDAVA